MKIFKAILRFIVLSSAGAMLLHLLSVHNDMHFLLKIHCYIFGVTLCAISPFLPIYLLDD